jgi:hypothetical protein
VLVLLLVVLVLLLVVLVLLLVVVVFHPAVLAKVSIGLY